MPWRLQLKRFLAVLDGFLLLLHGDVFCSLIWPCMEPTVHAQLGSAFEAVLHRLRAHAGREGHFCALGSEPGVLWQTRFLFQFSGIHTQEAQTLDLISLVSFLLLSIPGSRQQHASV